MIDTIRHGQDTMTAEFRSLRWSMLGLIVFLVASVVAMKGIDPAVPASTVPAVLGGPVP